MTEQLIIAVAIIIALGGHWLLFNWVKFKMDEASITKFLRESGEYCRSEVVSSNTEIAVERVSAVCAKSKLIERHAEEESWRLT